MLDDDPGCACCDDLEPHPELVAAQRVTTSEIVIAAAFRGVFPAAPYIPSAVPR